MDTEVEMQEEDPLLIDTAPQSQKEFFLSDFETRTDSDAVLLDGVIKTETSETIFPDFSSPKEEECLNQIKSENVTCINNCERNIKREVEEQTLVLYVVSQNETEFLPEDTVIEVKNNNDHEINKQVQIKDEPWWLETGISSVYDDIKNGDFPPAKPPRLCTETVSGDSSGKPPLSTVEDSGKGVTFCNREDGSECVSENGVTEILSVEHVLSEKSEKCRDVGKMNSRAYLKQKDLIPKSERPYKCSICGKSFTQESHLKSHEFIHGDKSLHRCEICDQSFTHLSHFQIHNKIHEGKKVHKCEICRKTFISFSKLERHSMIHEGIKPFKCKTCGKSFTQVSNLKKHNLTHEGKKPYKCTTCDKRFTDSGSLKEHKFIHEQKKPHRCEICDQGFIYLSSLRRHNLVHEGKKPHKCKSCDKSFTQLSHLEIHILSHEGKRPHKCKTCDKSFTQSSHLKRHYLIHEAKKVKKEFKS